MDKQKLKSIKVGGVEVRLMLESCMGYPFFSVEVEGAAGCVWAGADRREAFEAFSAACRASSVVKPEGGRK